MKVDDSSIGNGLSSSDSLFLITSNGVAIDSVGWSDNIPGGFSIEKKYFELPLIPGNWLPSLDSLGTPGLPNSIAPLEIDGTVQADSISHSPVFPTESEETIFLIPVINNGNSTLFGSITLFETSEEIANSTFSNLEILDKIIISLIIPPQSPERHIFDIELTILNDLNYSDNFAVDTLEVSYPFGSVVFNEFLPIPDSTQTEFVELYSFFLQIWKGGLFQTIQR